MEKSYAYEFDVLMLYGQQFKVTVYGTCVPMAYRNLYQLIQADAVSEARISMTDSPAAIVQS